MVIMLISASLMSQTLTWWSFDIETMIYFMILMFKFGYSEIPC